MRVVKSPVKPQNHAPCKMSLVLHLALRCSYNQPTRGKRNFSSMLVPIPAMSKYALETVCRTPAHLFFLTKVNIQALIRIKSIKNVIRLVVVEVTSLTAVLARTLSFGRGIKPVRSASATTPIGNTECGS